MLGLPQSQPSFPSQPRLSRHCKVPARLAPGGDFSEKPLKIKVDFDGISQMISASKSWCGEMNPELPNNKKQILKKKTAHHAWQLYLQKAPVPGSPRLKFPFQRPCLHPRKKVQDMKFQPSKSEKTGKQSLAHRHLTHGICRINESSEVRQLGQSGQ